jgi:outer membrane biosynthesis protein TonB
MNRSTAALIIAILLHLLIIALFVILGMLVPTPDEKPEEEEHRIRVSLKEQPKAAKDALVKNRVQKDSIAPPMPKGKQLEQLVTKPLKKVPPKPHKKPEPVIKKSTPSKPVKKTEKLPDASKHIPVPEKPVKTVPVKKKEQEPKEESGQLYSKLLKSTVSTAPEAERKTNERASKITKNIREAYGDTFGELSAGEQKFILDNQEIMRRITQQTLNRVARTNIPDNLRVTAFNVIEFYLYPNGDISDIKFITRSGFYMLDDTTVETIQFAYGRYPKPDQKTLIRYKVGYFLRGY